MGAAFAELSTIGLSFGGGDDGGDDDERERGQSYQLGKSGDDERGHAINSTKLAIGAAAWIASTIKADGTVPYIVTPPCTDHVLYQPISYSAEAFIDADLRFPSAVHKQFAAKLNSTVRTLHVFCFSFGFTSRAHSLLHY